MKIFSHSYLNDFDILKNCKIGIEFEFMSKLSLANTLEILSRKLDKNIFGFKQYHSEFKLDDNNWKLEPDWSAPNCAELITSPLSYSEARIYLTKIYNIIQEIGYTTERTGLHINISFDTSFANIESINPVKLALNIDESKIYELFPERENNIYCKSIKNIIPYKEYDFSSASSMLMSSSLGLHSKMSKYYGVNFTCLNQGRLEFRYIGGEDYEYKINESLELMDYFIMTTYTSLGNNFPEKEAKMLRRYLDDKIGNYKSLSKLENFITKYPHISLQVDKSQIYETLKSYYSTIYEKIYDMMCLVSDIDTCIINFDTETREIEIVDGRFKITGYVSHMTFIRCQIEGGDYNVCEFYDCDLKNSIINQSIINFTRVDDGKLLSSSVIKNSELTNCYFNEGVMDGVMKSGVFKNGKIGDNAIIEKDVIMLNDDSNFFNIPKQDINFKKK